MQKYFPNEMIGNKYGKLTVISTVKQDQKTYLKCKCDCGNVIVRPTYLIATNQIKSCGCLKAEAIKKYNSSGMRSKGCYKDGRSLHPLYGTWFQMISRCENPNQNHYDRYGGRGIKVCDEWHDFWQFVKWSDSVGGRPKGYTLDRIDNNGNYEPNNCRWADWRTQTTNKSSNVFIEFEGQTKTVTEWAEFLNFHPHTLQERLKKGWSVERALTEPPSENSQKSRNKILNQYSMDGILVNKYKSLSELKPPFKKQCVSQCAIGKRNSYLGYIWKYEDE